jgi:hypothetical protein
VLVRPGKPTPCLPRPPRRSITFGGGGIFGACKDISISEINGGVSLSADPSGVGPDGVYHPARMVWQFEAGSGDKGQPPAARSPPRKQPAGAARPDSGSAGSAGGSSSSSYTAAANGRPGSGPLPPSPAARTVSTKSEPGPGGNGEGLRGSSQRAPQRPADGGVNRRAASFPSPRPLGGAEGAATPRQPPPGEAPAHSEGGRNGKGRGFAARFLKRLGSKKERFQGGVPPHLQPPRDDDEDIGDGSQPRRSLASKLLSRRASSMSGSQRGGPGLERLAFGGQQLGRRQSGAAGFSADDDASHRSQGSGGGGSDAEYEEGGLGAVLEGGSDGERAGGGGAVVEHDEGDGSLASEDGSSQDGDVDDAEPLPSPLTQEALQRAHSQREGLAPPPPPPAAGSSGSLPGAWSSGRGSWLRGGNGAASAALNSAGDAMSVLDDGTSSVLELGDAGDAAPGAGAGGFAAPRGVFVSGRLKGFELVGERGSKVPNLVIGQADVRATVFVRFVFEYVKGVGWRPGDRPGDRPQFHVENLKYSISGNNVPMPATLIKHILRLAIPGLIQRRLLGLLPREFGDYLAAAHKGVQLGADVALVGPALAVLDADLGFEVRGPARSAREARQQQARYAAAKEARGLLGLSLPQAQVLAELFAGGAALLDPPRPASIAALIHLAATYERHPRLYAQLCQVVDAAYHVLAQAQGQRAAAAAADFSFPAFMAGPVARMRGKPARARVVMRSLDAALNADAILTAIHDFTQRTLEELTVKGPLLDPGATLESMRASVAGELEVLHAWHAFALQELKHFKGKYRGGGGTLLAAADRHGFSAGIENCFYEGPLRLRVPVAMRLDPDGAFSFDLPLPGPTGKLGVVRRSLFWTRLLRGGAAAGIRGAGATPC